MTNFVLVLVDDMRYDLLPQLAEVRGSVFERGHNSNPVCVPSRTSILTGNHSQSTGMYGNSPPVGGYAMFDDSDTLPLRLRAGGYTSGLFGKYLNDYNPEHATRIPPGWDDWWAITSDGDDYYGYQVSDGGVPRTYGHAPEDYLTDVIARRAEHFCAVAPEPFFAMVTPVAPHIDAVPADRYLGALRDRPYHPASFNVSGKDQPDWLRQMPKLNEQSIETLGLLRLNMRRTLLAVDDLMLGIRRTLASRGILEETIVIFASDNGYMWGEHKLTGKSVPYLEATRMAFVVQASEFFGFRPNHKALVQNIDIAPTILDIAELPTDGMDGKSLVPELSGATGRDYLIVEHHAQGRVPAFVKVITKTNQTYTWLGTGEEELYDLNSDPLQMTNLATDPPSTLRQKTLRQIVKDYVGDKPPPGMDVLP